MLTTRVARARACTLIRDETYTPGEMRTRRKGGSESKPWPVVDEQEKLVHGPGGENRGTEGGRAEGREKDGRGGEGRGVCHGRATKTRRKKINSSARVRFLWANLTCAFCKLFVRSFTAHGFNRSRRAGLIGLAYNEKSPFSNRHILGIFSLLGSRNERRRENREKTSVERRQMSLRSKCFERV